MKWLKNWQWFHKADTLQLFLYLLVNANTEDRYWQGILIKRGQIVVTIPSLAEVLDSTVQKVRTNLERLSTSYEINRQVTNKFSIVTICNYDSYVSVKTDNQQPTNRQPTANQQPTNRQPTANQQPIKETNKENISPTPPIKENKKENYSSSSSSSACERSYIDVMRSDIPWGEVIAMRYSLGSLDALNKWIDDFSLDLQCRDIIHKNLQDAKRHFCDWLRIQLRAQSNGQKTYTTSNTARERIIRERQEQHLRDIEKLNASYLAKIGENPG